MDAKRGEETSLVGAASQVKEGVSHSNSKGSGSLDGNDMFVRADKIDLRSLDIQLEKTLSKIWLKERRGSQKPSEEWEIDLSKLEIRYVIARGTYGTVYRGVYDGQDVAVKLLDWGQDGVTIDAETAALRASFQQEVAVWHRLDHPNVTKFVGASMWTSNLKIPQNDSTSNCHSSLPTRACCVVVEYLAGGTLKQYLIKNRRRKLPYKIVIQVALDLARGSLMNLRPEIPRCCPSSLANIMRKCWDANPDKRLEMYEVVKLLEAIDTSKGGGMVPEDRAAGCLCFSLARGP